MFRLMQNAHGCLVMECEKTAGGHAGRVPLAVEQGSASGALPPDGRSAELAFGAQGRHPPARGRFSVRQGVNPLIVLNASLVSAAVTASAGTRRQRGGRSAKRRTNTHRVREEKSEFGEQAVVLT